MLLDLAVVMPVYNEVECIADVVQSWLSELTRLDVRFRLIVLNDGSHDGTDKVLEAFRDNANVEVINQVNRGHGPTILTGYRKAVQFADWIFQCDSDNEMSPEFFHYLWEKRKQFDALFGIRQNRNQNLPRKLITSCSRITVRLLFSSGVTDVNTPYRLLRSKVLLDILHQIPANTFAPNVLISGILARYRFRIYEHPVPHKNRKTGQVSIVKWRLWRAALKSLWQTFSCSKTITLMPR